MKRLITSLLTLLMIFTVSATVKERNHEQLALPGAKSVEVVKNNQPQTKIPTISTEFTPVAKKTNKLAKEGEQTFQVKCVFKHDPEKYRPDRVVAYNADSQYTEGCWWGEVCFYMTPGVYDFITQYTKLCDISYLDMEGWAYLILEDVEVKGDIEIVFDASLITETISFETYNPDGEKTTLDCVRFINDKYKPELVSKGNVSDFRCTNLIFHKDYDYGFLRFFINTGAGVEVEPGPFGEWRSEWKSNIYVNPVSDKYQFCQSRLIYNDKECWFVPMFADGSRTQTVTNKGDKYSDLYNVNFEKTPAGMMCEVQTPEPYYISYGINRIGLPIWILDGIGCDVDLFFHYRFCQTASSLLHPEYISAMKFSIEDTAVRNVYQDFDEEGNVISEDIYYATTQIISPQIFMGIESCDVYPKINTTDLFYLEGGIETADSRQDLVSYKITPQSMPVFGSMPQFMRFYYLTDDSECDEYPYPMLSYEAYDYYGDSVTSIDGEIKVSVNGNVVATSEEEIWDWQNSCLESQMETGKLVFDYLNNNIEIDGLSGKNSAKVCVDNSVENFTMPLIQMVQMRDGNNRPAASFSDPSEGHLLVTGGDFHKIDGPLNQYGYRLIWYDTYDCDLKVEYAPYGSNDFSPIEMKQEGDMMIGFGYPYIGSLESVDRESATGWFDLRVIMTDAAGNTNEQIISPAFKIDRLTGTQQVCVNKANLRVIGNLVVADNGADVEVFTLSGQRVENKNLPAGLYMARSGDSVAKLMVR